MQPEISEERVHTGHEPVKTQLPVTGMSCASCAVTVQKVVASQKGVKDATVNFANETLTVNYDPHATNLHKLKHAVKEVGYDLQLNEDSHDHESEFTKNINTAATSSLQRQYPFGTNRVSA